MSMPCGVNGCPRNALNGLCFVHKPKKPLNRVKRMKKIGRIGQKLIDQRREYLKAFPAPHYCFYCVYLGYEQELDEKDIQIEHLETKSDRPDLRFDWSNLAKSCAFHNELKGEKSLQEFLRILDKEYRLGEDTVE